MPPLADSDSAPLRVSSVQELFDREEEILQRIRARRNGGLLFLLAPLRLLADVGVEIDPAVTAWIEEQEPAAVQKTAPGAYESVANSDSDSSMTVQLDGLFRPPTP
jgi:hypothetical protein